MSIIQSNLSSLPFQWGKVLKQVSERLGHSAIGITMDTYPHMMPGMDEGAAQQLDEVYRAAAKKR